MKHTDKYQDSNGRSKHLDENELAQYADYLRNNTGNVPEELIEHVASCGYCRAELMAISDLLDTLPDLAEDPDIAYATDSPVAGRHRPVAFRWLRTVAAVAAVVLLAWVILRVIPDGRMNEPVASGPAADSMPASDRQKSDPSVPEQLTAVIPAADPATRPAETDDSIRYAGAFLPDPTYESLVRAKYRSGTDPRVTGPDPSSVFARGDTLRISWIPDPEDEYRLVILDNKTALAADLVISGSSLDWRIDLQPGLYYWKFTGREEMWKVGKFKVSGINKK
jgi:hypothetical protein